METTLSVLDFRVGGSIGLQQNTTTVPRFNGSDVAEFHLHLESLKKTSGVFPTILGRLQVIPELKILSDFLLVFSELVIKTIVK